MSEKEVRNILNYYYESIKNDKYLKKHFKDYKDLLFGVEEYPLKEGPLRYFSNDEIITLVGNFLKEYYPDLYDTYLLHSKLKLAIYPKKDLEEYIGMSKEEILTTKKKLPPLTLEEAKALLSGEGYYDYILKDINIVSTNDINTAITLIHEYTHKIYDDFNSKQNTECFYLYTEYLAYLNSFYFGDYLESLGYFSDYEISNGILFDNIMAASDIFMLMDDYYKKKPLEETDFELITECLKEDYIPLNDYHHLIAFLTAFHNYQETKDIDLSKRCDILAKDLSKTVDSKVMAETGLDLQDKRLIKKYTKKKSEIFFCRKTY